MTSSQRIVGRLMDVAKKVEEGGTGGSHLFVGLLFVECYYVIPDSRRRISKYMSIYISNLTPLSIDTDSSNFGYTIIK